MGLYDQMFSASPSLGGGAPSAFSSPGTNPQMLAMLMAMQQHAGQGAGLGGSAMNPAAGAAASPQLPRPPAIGQSAPQPGAIPAVAGPQQSQILQMLMANPNLLKGLGGGAPGAAGGAGGGGLFGMLGNLFGGTPLSTAPSNYGLAGGP